MSRPMNADERREFIIERVRSQYEMRSWTNGDVTADFYDDLQAVLDDLSPTLGDALRYGLEPVAVIGDLEGNTRIKTPEMEVPLYRVADLGDE